MERQRDRLVPVADTLADLGGPVKAIREASPQARHHFTQADQVNQLISVPAKRSPDLRLHGADDGAVQHCLAPTPATSTSTRASMVRTNSS